MPDPRFERLRSGLADLQLAATEQQCRAFIQHLDLVERWNRQINLTAVRDPLEMVTRHLLDALSVAPWVTQSPVLDIGSGAGLPGIPLAILRPDQQWHLVDSSGKRTGFLRELCRQLQLTNVQVSQGRIETFTEAGPFPAAIARAFASLGEIADNAAHLLQPGANLWAMKGRYPQAELAELPEHFRLVEVFAIEVPGLHEDRHLVQLVFTPES